MKKIIGFLIVAALAACTCLSQIPDQLVYVDQNCEAVMPDYTSEVIVIDNCDNASVIQVPVAGVVLTSAMPTTQVVITANDISGNSASISFNVILVDTIAPTIQARPSLLTYTQQEQGDLITAYHHSVGQVLDSACANCPDSLQYLFCDSTWYSMNMLTASAPVDSVGGMAHVSWFIPVDKVLCQCDSTQLANLLVLEFTTK